VTMTTAAHPAIIARPIRVEDSLTVCWMISRAALAAARPQLRVRDGGGPIVLELFASPLEGRWFCEATLVDGGRRDRVPLAGAEPGAWSRDAETGLEHLEIPAVLHATYRRGERGVRLLYARTPLLTALGIPGGRYELIAN